MEWLKSVASQITGAIGVSLLTLVGIVALSIVGLSATAAIVVLTQPPWNWIFIGFILGGLMLVAVQLAGTPKPARAPASADPPQTDLLGANAAYLAWLAREDLGGPDRPVNAVCFSTYARVYLRDLDNLTAEFGFTLVNAAPFRVQVEDVKGQLVCAGKAFRDSPKLTTRPGEGIQLPHGEWQTLVLRQHLTTQEVAAVREQLQSNRGLLDIYLNELTVLVKLSMQARPLHTIPNAPVTIRPIRLPNFVRAQWPDRLVDAGWP